MNNIGKEFLMVFPWILGMLHPQKSGQVGSLGEKGDKLVRIIQRSISNSTRC